MPIPWPLLMTESIGSLLMTGSIRKFLQVKIFTAKDECMAFFLYGYFVWSVHIAHSCLAFPHSDAEADADELFPRLFGLVKSNLLTVFILRKGTGRYKSM